MFKLVIVYYDGLLQISVETRNYCSKRDAKKHFFAKNIKSITNKKLTFINYCPMKYNQNMQKKLQIFQITIIIM